MILIYLLLFLAPFVAMVAMATKTSVSRLTSGLVALAVLGAGLAYWCVFLFLSIWFRPSLPAVAYMVVVVLVGLIAAAFVARRRRTSVAEIGGAVILCVSVAAYLSAPLIGVTEDASGALTEFREVTLPSALNANVERPTGLQALRASLPELRERFPKYTVRYVSLLERGRIDGRGDAWEIGIYGADRDTGAYGNRQVVHRFWGEVADSSSASERPSLSPDEPLMGLSADTQLPPFIDSDQAIRLAEEQIGAAYRASTSAKLTSVMLYCLSGCDWFLEYRYGYDILALNVNAETGRVDLDRLFCGSTPTCGAQVPGAFADGRPVQTPTPLTRPTRPAGLCSSTGSC